MSDTVECPHCGVSRLRVRADGKIPRHVARGMGAYAGFCPGSETDADESVLRSKVAAAQSQIARVEQWIAKREEERAAYVELQRELAIQRVAEYDVVTERYRAERAAFVVMGEQATAALAARESKP